MILRSPKSAVPKPPAKVNQIAHGGVNPGLRGRGSKGFPLGPRPRSPGVYPHPFSRVPFRWGVLYYRLGTRFYLYLFWVLGAPQNRRLP